MRLHVIRHAKTNQVSESGKDYDRALLPKGIAQCELLKDYLKSKNSTAGIILCSAARRTKQTYELIASGIENKGELRFEKNLYLASKEDLLSFLCNLPEAEEVFLIGHNFGISDLVSYLCDSDFELRTSEYVCIEFKGMSLAEISGGTGIIVDRYRAQV